MGDFSVNILVNSSMAILKYRNMNSRINSSLVLLRLQLQWPALLIGSCFFDRQHRQHVRRRLHWHHRQRPDPRSCSAKLRCRILLIRTRDGSPLRSRPQPRSVHKCELSIWIRISHEAADQQWIQDKHGVI